MGALSVISKAIEQAKKKPWTVVTDGNPSYRGGVKRNGIRMHVFSPKFVDPENNDTIENLHSQLRPRYDVARIVGTPATGNALADAFMLSYNFVRPKAALGNKTPAETAGIAPEGRNVWFALTAAASTMPKKPQSGARLPRRAT